METLGVVVEQHPDRARLFMQWKRMEWPLLWDPFNILELPAVPYTLVLDPDGVIRLLNPRIDRLDAVERFLAAPPDADPEVPESPVPPAAAMASPQGGDAGAWSDHAVALALWGGDERLDEAAVAAERATMPKDGSGSANAWFRRGVILRMRHDSGMRRDRDFSNAATAWAEALRRDPNNYIWRRRLQQYGPRLAKPYSFYDWVPVAREAIRSDGRTPEPLVVEPGGAEFAEPIGPGENPTMEATGTVAAAHPDPDARITVDDLPVVAVPMVDVDVVVVPPSAPPGDAVMVHIEMTPSAEASAHWNNEAGAGEMWVDVPDGWHVTPRLQSLPEAAQPTSDERRHVEFEVRIPADAETGVYETAVSTFYYVCDDATGTCLYRRRNITVGVPVDARDAGLHD